LPTAALGPIDVAITVWVFALGCAVGSHLNVWIWRLPRGISVDDPRRSVCPRCGCPIRWRDNVPLLSFILLKGRCRVCGAPISPRYFVVEALTGTLFALIYYRQGVQVGVEPAELLIMMLAVSLLIVASAVDLDYFIIPDEVSVFGIMGGLLAGFLVPGLHVGTASYHTYSALTGHRHVDGLIASAIGAFGGGGLMVVAALVGFAIFRREAMGLGDAKLMAMIGAFFGWKVVIATFFLAPFLGMLYGLPLILTSGEHVMPYGPFLSMGAVFTIVFRNRMCDLLGLLRPIVELARMALD